MRCLLGVISIAMSYSITSERKLELWFDMSNKFEIPIDNISYEDYNLLEILFYGITQGANFVIGNDIDIKNYRSKTFKIIKEDDKKIIETYDGIKFYIDSIHTRNSIVECFVNKVHMINFDDDWNNKIVIDAGAECGDTPLYYASMGAKVYAFEPIKANFDAMVRNISLNPELSKRIVPINAAIGKDGVVTFYQNPNDSGLSSSFVYNAFGKSAKLSEIKCYSLESVLEEFDIKYVNLLKMDCKGCEKFLTLDVLKNVDKVKIEYDAVMYGAYKLEDLLNLLKKAGFEYMLYEINPFDYPSIKVTGHIYGKRP